MPFGFYLGECLFGNYILNLTIFHCIIDGLLVFSFYFTRGYSPSWFGFSAGLGLFSVNTILLGLVGVLVVKKGAARGFFLAGIAILKIGFIGIGAYSVVNFVQVPIVAVIAGACVSLVGTSIWAAHNVGLVTKLMNR